MLDSTRYLNLKKTLNSVVRFTDNLSKGVVVFVTCSCDLFVDGRSSERRLLRRLNV